MNTNDSTETTNCTASSETAQPIYVQLEPSCPLCGNTRFSSTEEGIPHSHDSHRVHVTCANCRTLLTIQFRAIDVAWYDGHDEHHSAVSQSLLTPTQTEYIVPEMYGPLPDTAALKQLDWPRHCEDCNELLTGNDMLTESDATDSTHILFRCPNCDHRSSGMTNEKP
jgi:transcription elongation factor Elf1